MFNYGSLMTISNSTLSGNAGTVSGGSDITNTTALDIQATIIADGFGATDCYGPGLVDLGYNLDDDGSCGLTTPGSLSDVASGLDPSGLSTNGGTTETIALDPGSNAIDAVHDTSLCPATDQRGAPRTDPCDIGAFDSDVSPFNGITAVYKCNVPGYGPIGFPTVLSESPTPPSSLDIGGTFQTALTVQSGIPAVLTNQDLESGVSSFTIDSESVTMSGRVAPGGALSGAISPKTQSVSANNLPQTFSHFHPDTPIIVDTIYNPTVWQAGPGTGLVDLLPGSIQSQVTYVAGGVSTSESIPCSPPSDIAALGSTVVKPLPATPTFQVPPTTPPLQNKVSASADGGWSATIANTSKTSVTGLQANVNVSDGGAPPSFDLTGMAAAGTICKSSGSGRASCTIGTLSPGASEPLNLFVNTTGLASGISISGSAALTSTNASSHTSALSAIGVVVVPNGTIAVAVPGIPLASSKSSLSKAKAIVTLTLPKAKAKAKLAGGPTGFADPLTTTLVNGTSVAATLTSLAPSAEPALCPATGLTKCEGSIVQVFGNFSAYTNKLNPIAAQVQIKYGVRVPSGSIYFLKPNGKTVDKLTLCKKTATGYSTPCLATKETVGGSASMASLFTQDIVYFTGNDPAMGRR